MALGILIELRDAGGTPVANRTGVRGWVFDAANVTTPLVDWTLPSDAQGQITIPANHLTKDQAVLVAATYGSVLAPAAWEAHFAQHRVQEY